jgi:hypothetical protein
MAFLIPFVPAHLAKMKVKADAHEVADTPGVSETLVRLGAKSLVAGDGTVLGVIGVAPTLPGVCEVFILASEDQTRFPISFARCVHKEVSKLCSKYRRIQAVTANDSFHRRWITWLGFSEEGILRKYGLQGQDMVMWSLV